MKLKINKYYSRYDVALICWILYSVFVGATTISFNSFISRGWYALCVLLLLWNLMNVKLVRRNYKTLLSTLFFIGIGAVVAYKSGYPPMFAWIIMVVVSAEIKHRHIVEIYWRCYLFICIIIPLLAFANIIPNSVIDTVGNAGKRFAYGFSHPNVFAASILILIICWCYLNWHRIRIGHVVVIDVVGFILMKITDSSAGFICIIFMSAITLLERWFDKKGKIRIWYYVTIALLVLLPLTSYYFMINYSLSNAWALILDSLTTGRVHLMSSFYSNYGWTILGQSVLMDTTRRSNFLFALDNSYAYLLIRFGIIITILYYVGIGIEIIRSAKKRDNRLIICIMTFMVYGLFENYFFKMQFNFTLLFILSTCFEKYSANTQDINSISLW